MNFWNLDHDDENKETPEQRAERVEDTLALALMARDPLVLAWSAISEQECRCNRSRYTMARARAAKPMFPQD